MPEATSASQAVVDLVKHRFSLAWRSWREGLSVAFGVVLGADYGMIVLGSEVSPWFWWHGMCISRELQAWAHRLFCVLAGAPSLGCPVVLGGMEKALVGPC